MAWGDNWGNQPGQNALALAAAFQDGRVVGTSKNNVEISRDGVVWYTCNGQAIARRILDEHLPKWTARALEGEGAYERLAFRAGSADKATARHLKALGVEAEWLSGGRPFLMNGVDVSDSGWYTLEQLASMPKWEELFEPRPSRIYVPNPTLPLFA